MVRSRPSYPIDFVPTRYTTVAIALHWSIAALILFNLAVGFFMEGFKAPWKGIVVPIHISCGMTVLVLTVLRVVWRLSNTPPPFHPALSSIERCAAHAAHALLYALMIVMPLTGWSIISAHPPHPGAGPPVWGLFHLPPIAPIAHLETLAQKSAHESFVHYHSIGAWILVALLALHVAAALKHQWFDRHAEFARMGIGGDRA